MDHHLLPAVTDEQIQKWVYEKHHFLAHPSWITHCRQLCGLPVENVREYRQARENPCPASEQKAIMEAIRELGLLAEGGEWLIGLA